MTRILRRGRGRIRGSQRGRGRGSPSGRGRKSNPATAAIPATGRERRGRERGRVRRALPAESRTIQREPATLVPERRQRLGRGRGLRRSRVRRASPAESRTIQREPATLPPENRTIQRTSATSVRYHRVPRTGRVRRRNILPVRPAPPPVVTLCSTLPEASTINIPPVICPSPAIAPPQRQQPPAPSSNSSIWTYTVDNGASTYAWEPDSMDNSMSVTPRFNQIFENLYSNVSSIFEPPGEVDEMDSILRLGPDTENENSNISEIMQEMMQRFPHHPSVLQAIPSSSDEHGPTSPEEMAALPHIKFSPQMIPNEQISCVICQDDFKENEECLKLPCDHIYHIDCITPWLEENNTCPACRFELKKDQEHDCICSEQSVRVERTTLTDSRVEDVCVQICISRQAWSHSS